MEPRISFIPNDLTEEERKANLIKVFDVCNSIKELRDIPECWYTDEEIKELKENKELREKMGVKFI